MIIQLRLDYDVEYIEGKRKDLAVAVEAIKANIFSSLPTQISCDNAILRLDGKHFGFDYSEDLNDETT